MSGIEWSFTGEGWPGQALNLPYDKMPDFYNSGLHSRPSLYEGGPMCVVEGLACGKEIIASDVGWVKEFPHILRTRRRCLVKVGFGRASGETSEPSPGC